MQVILGCIFSLAVCGEGTASLNCAFSTQGVGFAVFAPLLSGIVLTWSVSSVCGCIPSYTHDCCKESAEVVVYFVKAAPLPCGICPGAPVVTFLW